MYLFCFWCGPFLKSFLNLLQHCLCFMCWLFGPEACGIPATGPGIEPAPPALEGEVLTTGPPGKSLFVILNEVAFDIFFFWCFRVSNPVWGRSGKEGPLRKWNMRRRSLPSGQDERRACLAEGSARAEAQRHERMRCTCGAVSLTLQGPWVQMTAEEGDRPWKMRGLCERFGLHPAGHGKGFQ